MAQRTKEPFQIENPADGWEFRAAGIFRGWVRVRVGPPSLADVMEAEAFEAEADCISHGSDGMDANIAKSERLEYLSARAQIQVQVRRSIRKKAGVNRRPLIGMFDGDGGMDSAIKVVRDELNGVETEATSDSVDSVVDMRFVDIASKLNPALFFQGGLCTLVLPTPGTIQRLSPHRPGAPSSLAA